MEGIIQDLRKPLKSWMRFVGTNFLEENTPEATTLLQFRRLLEQHGLNKLFFDVIRVIVKTGHMLKGGTEVDATIINAASEQFAEGFQKFSGMESRHRAAKSSVRCKAEHPFRIIKCLFGYRKVAYKGVAKNENRLYALFASANLYALASYGRSLANAW